MFHLVRADLTVTPRRRALYRTVARGRQKWVCGSEDNRITLAAQFGVPRKRIQIVRNGVVVRVASTDTRQRVRSELGVPDDGTLVLTVGRLGAQKDHGVIVEALSELTASDEGLVFVWAGDGPSRDELGSAVRATGLASHVRMLGRRDDVPELLAAADLFLMPSRDEGGAPPFALAEAMLAGVPAVVSDIGAFTEVITDGRNGVVFTQGDPRDLARTVQSALSDREKLSRIATTAREQALREFTAERMTEGMLAHILGEAAPSSP